VSIARETVRPIKGASRIARFIAVTACLLTTFAVVNFSNVRANAVTWTPSSLGSSLALWLDADDASTITSSAGLVSEWRDKSGNNRDATQADPNSRPSTNGSGLTFDSSNKFMTGVMNPNTMATSVQVTVVFTRACCGANGYDSHPFTLTSNNYPTPYDGYNDTLLVGGPTSAYWGEGGFANISTLTTRTLLSTSMSATKVAQYLNGTLQKSVEGNFPYEHVPSIYYVATRDDRYTHFTGEINEIVVTRELSNANRSNLEAYLGSKWAIAGAPTTTAPPATTTTSTTTTVPRPTTTTTAPARVIEIDIQAPTATLPVGQGSIATIAPGTQPAATTPQRSTTTTSSTVPSDVSASEASPKPVLPQAPVIPQLSAGEGAVDIAGKTVKQTLTRKDNQLQIQSGSLSATLSKTNANGVTAPLDNDGNLRLVSGDIMKINLGGFKPNSNVTIWFFSTPIKLGTAKVKPDGTVSAVVRVPNEIDDGPHRVAVVAEMTNGKPATFTLGVVVGKFKTTSTLTRVLIVVPIVLAILLGVLLPNRLRRRRIFSA
jgi:hypothetical protein